jgi:hypothetical protein
LLNYGATGNDDEDEKGRLGMGERILRGRDYDFLAFAVRPGRVQSTFYELESDSSLDDDDV